MKNFDVSRRLSRWRVGLLLYNKNVYIVTIKSDWCFRKTISPQAMVFISLNMLFNSKFLTKFLKIFKYFQYFHSFHRVFYCSECYRWFLNTYNISYIILLFMVLQSYNKFLLEISANILIKSYVFYYSKTYICNI